MINIPQNSQSMQNIYRIFTENIKKMKTYFSLIFNPVTITKLIIDINALIMIKDPQ
jgi:hypothetical protein